MTGVEWGTIDWNLSRLEAKRKSMLCIANAGIFFNAQSTGVILKIACTAE